MGLKMANDNIFQQYLRPPKSIAEYSSEMDEAEGRKQTLRQNALTLAASKQKYDDGMQSAARQNQLRGALSSLGAGATDEDRVKAMRGTGSQEGFAAADALEKSIGERRKSTAAADRDDAETKKTNLARDVALHDFHAQKLATVQTPQDALAWAQEGMAMGLFKQPGQFEQGIAKIQQAAQNPRSFAQWKEGAMRGGQSVTAQLKQQLDQIQADETARHNKSTENIAIRGQNMVDARAREQNAKDQSGKAPAGYRWTASGELEAIPGGPAGNKATSSEGERKAATLLQRLEFSEKQLEAAVKQDPDAAKPSLVANGLRAVGMEAAANTMTDSERQRVEAAQLDILDAALTLGTGAAYTREQLEGYRKSYFPQVGDTKENVRDKKARLQNVINAAKTQAGRSAPKSPASPTDSAQQPPGADGWTVTPIGQ
jgi:hypothetical protein